jgi:hypothetical protein
LATLTQPSRLLERQRQCTTTADPIQLVRICLPTRLRQAADMLANLSKSLGEYTSNCSLAASNSPCISYYDATFHKQCRIVKDHSPRQPTPPKHCPNEQRKIPPAAILTCGHWPDKSKLLSKAKRGKIAFPAVSQGKEQIYPSSPSVSKAPWENFSADFFGRFWPVSVGKELTRRFGEAVPSRSHTLPTSL